MKIPGYQIERELGRGGMAVVYLALQESLGRHVALKVLSPALAADRNFTERFIKEKQIIAQLSHPGIVTVFDFGASDDNYYLTMELLSGGSLKERIDRGVSYEESNEIIEIVASALEYAHNKNCIHRDVKAQNIMFSGDGRAVLTDFGIAKLIGSDTQLTTPGMMIGSPIYMSPEQITSQGELDRRSDIYSLGVLYYQMLTGTFPYQAENLVALAHKHAFAPLPQLPPEYQHLQPVFDKLLAKKAEDRFPTALAFLEALDKVRHQGAGGGRQHGPAPTKTYRMPSQFGLRSGRQPVPDPIRGDGRDRQSDGDGGGGVSRYVKYATFALLPAALAGALYWFYPLLSGDDDADPPAVATPSGGEPRDGATPIADLLEAARAARDDGRFEQGLELVDQGLQRLPSDRQLLTLREQIVSAQRARAEAEADVAAAADRAVAAQRALEQNRLDDGDALIAEGLGLDPQNPALLALRDQIAARRAQQQTQADAERARSDAEGYLDAARSALANDQLEVSLLLAERGLALVADFPELVELQRSVREQLSQREQRQRQVDSLLVAAGAALASGDFDEGLRLSGEGLQLDPQDQRLRDVDAELRRGRDQAARQRERDDLLGAARAARQAGELRQSLELLDRALERAPEDAQLVALRDTVERERAELERRQAEQQAARAAAERLQRRLDELLDNARRALAAGELEDAAALAEQGLEIAPQNAALLSLQNELETRRAERERAERRAELLAAALTARDEERFEQGLALIEQGLELAPGDAELIELGDQIELQRAERERERVAAERRRAAAGEFLSDARAALQQDELARSLQLAERGLELLPDSAELRDVRDQAQTRIGQRDQQISALGAVAGAALDSGDYETGLAASAQALALAPQNQALRELDARLRQARSQQQARELAERERAERRAELLAGALTARDDGRFDRSLALIDEGLGVSPGDAEFSQLREEVERQRADAERRARAQQIEQQVDALLSAASAQLERGELDASRALVDEGLSLTDDAQRPALLALRDRIDAAVAERERLERALTQRLSGASRARAAGDYDRAETLLREGLKLSPQNPALLALLEQVDEARAAAAQAAAAQAAAAQAAAAQAAAAQAAAAQADAALSPAELNDLIARVETLQTDDPAAAQQLLDTALQRSPDNDQLQNLLKINRLLIAFDDHLQQLRLTTPAGNNAFDTLQEILALDRDNAAAAAGRRRIADRYLALANRNFARGRLDSSQKFARLGLQMQPENRPLSQLIAKIDAARAARQSRPRRSTPKVTQPAPTTSTAVRTSPVQPVQPPPVQPPPVQPTTPAPIAQPDFNPPPPVTPSRQPPPPPPPDRTMTRPVGTF